MALMPVCEKLFANVNDAISEIIGD
jgi:hypothetical protein